MLSYRAMKQSLEADGHTVETPEPKPRKPRNNEESRMQRAFITWWGRNCRHFNVPEILLFSIPNGFNGDARRGSVMKLEGQRKGCPDLFLAVPSETRFNKIKVDGIDVAVGMKADAGLFLELKRPAGIVSPEQEVFHQRLREQGYAVHVVRSLVECINVTTAYLTK